MADVDRKTSLGEMAGFAALGLSLAGAAGAGYCAWKLRETERVAASAQRLAALSLKESDINSIITQALDAYQRSRAGPAPAPAPAQPAAPRRAARAEVRAEARAEPEEEVFQEAVEAAEDGGLEELPAARGKRRSRRVAKEEE